MTETDYLSLCKAQWEKIKDLEECRNLYDMEEEFREIWQDLGRSVLERRIGEVPTDHMKKKSHQHVR